MPALTIEQREEIAEAIKICRPFYAFEVRKFAEGLLEEEAVRSAGKEVILEIISLAEIVKQHDHSEHYDSGPCLQLDKFQKYGPEFLKALVEQIRKVDTHAFSFSEAREYAKQRGICLQ